MSGILNNRGRFLNILSGFHLSKTNSDIILEVLDAKIPAHRFVLAAESPYFADVLSDHNTTEIQIVAPPKAFDLVLRYMYGLDIDVKAQEIDVVWDLVLLSGQYKLHQLKVSLTSYLVLSVRHESLLEMFSMANEMNLQPLVDRCLEFIDAEAERLFAREDFYSLSKNALLIILARKQKNTDEFVVYKAVKKWIDSNAEAKDDVMTILSHINVGLISDNLIKNDLRFSGLFELSDLFDAMTIRRDYVDVNYAVADKGFRVIEGLDGENLIQSDAENFARSIKKTDDTHVLTVDLGYVYLFNNIQLKLKASQWVAAEVSMDNKTWTKLFDFIQYACNGRINVYFVLTRGQYIRFISKRSELIINDFKVFHSLHPEPQIDAHTVPAYELVTPERCLALNAPFRDQLHQSSDVVRKIDLNTPFNIHFNQPYMLSTCSLHLWNEDGRKQSFVVEGYTDQGWQTLFEQTDKVQDLQHVEFAQTKISEFRVKGTGTTVGNDFCLLRFNVPSVLDDDDAIEFKIQEKTNE